MNGRTTTEIPRYSRQESTETLLSNSQSPSFAFQRRESNKKGNERSDQMSKLRVRDVKKRQKPASPKSLKKAHPVAKKSKKTTLCPTKAGKVNSDHCFQVKEDSKRRRAEAGPYMDKILTLDMYSTLSKSASLIPLPHTLLLRSDDDHCYSIRHKMCSIEDRKEAILNVFARRSSLKVSAETLHLGAALLDKCLDVMSVKTETLCELAAVTLVIASKIEDVNCLTLINVIDMNLIEDRPIGLIASLERFVLSSLSFKVTVPTPLSFAAYMLNHLCASQTKTILTHYFMELSLLYVHNRLFSSDIIAYAATCLAFAMETEAPSENHSIFQEYSTNEQNRVACRYIDSDLQALLRIDSA